MIKFVEIAITFLHQNKWIDWLPLDKAMIDRKFRQFLRILHWGKQIARLKFSFTVVSFDDNIWFFTVEFQHITTFRLFNRFQPVSDRNFMLSFFRQFNHRDCLQLANDDFNNTWESWNCFPNCFENEH